MTKNSPAQHHIPRPALGVSGGKGGWKPFQVSAADERFRMLSELNNFRNGEGRFFEGYLALSEMNNFRILEGSLL